MSNQRVARPAGPWLWRHKVITLIGLMLVLGSCGVAVTVQDDAGDQTNVGVMVDDDVTPDGPSDAPSADATREPTAQDRWRTAYESNEEAYLVAAAGALGLDELSGDAADFAVGTCQQLADGRPIERRVGRVVRELALPARSVPVATAVIGVTAEHVCPDLSGVHRTQVTARAEAVAEARRVAARERRQAAAAERRRVRAQQAQEEREAAQDAPADVYYENCTAVEAAGAAPIRAGDPGYSGDLDRDGDGVACEQ